MRLVLILLLISGTAYADSSTDEAVSQTQDLLRSKSQREKVLHEDKKARRADEQVQSLTKNKKTQEDMYGAAADVFPLVVKNAGDDPKKQQEYLNQMSAHPEEFYNSLTPEQQARIRDIASQIMKEGVPRSPQP